MNIKKRFILSSLGALSVFGASTSGMEMNNRAAGLNPTLTQNMNTLQQGVLNNGMPNFGSAQKINNSQKQNSSGMSNTKAALVSAGLALSGFAAGNLLQNYLCSQKINDITDEKNNTEARYNSLNDVLNNRYMEITKLTSSNSDLKEKIKHLEEENEKLKKDNEALNTKVKGLMNLGGDSAQQISNLQDEVKKYEDGFRTALINIRDIRNRYRLIAKEQKSPYMTLLCLVLNQIIEYNRFRYPGIVQDSIFPRGENDTGNDGGFLRNDLLHFFTTELGLEKKYPELYQMNDEKKNKEMLLEILENI